ncbi:MAG: hypothetical protein Q9168_001308 [Polycauliona sp. 1 TL-2023]
MAEYPAEKQSSTTGWPYDGLELDTRAGDGAEKHLDHTKPLPDLKRWQLEEDNKRYMNEKQMIDLHEVPQTSPTTDTSTSMGALSPRGPPKKDFGHPMGSAPEPRTRRICGLRRGLFWLMFGIVLALVIVAAVVGGVVGGTRHSSTSKPSPSPDAGSTPATPGAGNVPAEPADVVSGSPLNVISYAGPNNEQVFRVYYQSVLGNIKEAVSDRNLDAWASAHPIFTDAINNTGLATVFYANGSSSWGQMFYVGTNGYVQEKRKDLNDNETYWEPGSFNPNNIPITGNTTLPQNPQSLDPINSFDGYSMAAVYSDIFANGAGTRFFYHRSSDNGTNWVQEWIWTRETDDWKIGQVIPNVYPNSHIGATIDEQNRLLRLYFSIGNMTLQESYLNISDPQGLYNNGFTLRGLLPQNNVDLAVTSDKGTVYIYHPSNTGEIGVRELKVTGVPGGGLLSNFPQESFNLSEPVVAEPSLTSLEGTSPYSPIAASVTRAQDPKLPKSVFLFYAETVVGTQPANDRSASGYRSLQQVSRPLNSSVWDTAKPRTIPLGSDNTFPDPKQRRWLRWLL